ncbi:MAG TPA: type II toxin-antitoxin system prevent-host-death family antitoxin [Gaiellaceae bacterium]|nr:type II toxin-antitoxin system prevent-host-death family antitoxin [Gaiellaceae bacterium]
MNMREAKTHLSKLIKRAAAGEEVVVVRVGRPVARIVAYAGSSEPRTPGLLAGQIEICPDFDELPPAFGDAFGAE